MALSSLGGIASTALNNMQRNSEGIVQPLDAIESRRAARAAEAQKQQEADAASMKAAAQKQSAAEQQRAGEAKRAQDERVRVAYANMPRITVEDMSSPEYVQQLKAQIKYGMNSGEADLIESSQKTITQLKGIAETSENDPTTMGGAESQARVNELQSKTTLQNSMSRADVPMANKADQNRAILEVDKYDPGKQGTGIMGNLGDALKPNYTMAERTRLAGELAATVDQIKRNYSANNGGASIPEEYAWEQARARLGLGGPAQPAPQPAPQQAPQQQPQQQQAPQQEQALPGGITFDWSK